MKKRLYMDFRIIAQDSISDTTIHFRANLEYYDGENIAHYKGDGKWVLCYLLNKFKKEGQAYVLGLDGSDCDNRIYNLERFHRFDVLDYSFSIGQVV